MNRGLVDLKELRQNVKKADFSGKSAYCFIKDNKIVKVYARREDPGFYTVIDSNKVCDFSKFSADTIVFPQEYIYENGHIAGEISEYIKSKTIDQSFNNSAILKCIIDGYEKVVQDLYLYNNINMVDLCFVNILYSNKRGFHLIDTTEWRIEDNALRKNLYNLNLSLIDTFVERLDIPVTFSRYYSKVDDTYYKSLEKYGSAGKKMQNNIDILMRNKFHFMNLLYAYMEVYRVYASSDAIKLKDLNEFTKVLKKG